jgi:dephospho-CoA kinase
MLQRQRALLRPGMSDEKFKRILARQMPDKEKQRLANVVIPSSLGKRETWRRLKHVINAMMNGPSPGMARSDFNA